MSFPILETERLKLIEVVDDHAHRLFEIFSNPDVTQYYGMNPLEKLEQAENMVKHFRTIFDKKQGMRWAINYKEDNNFVGTIGLNNLSMNSRRAEVGYEIHPDYWRRGIATEAVKEVLNYSFNELQLNRMGAVTFPENKSSQQLLLKIGFAEEGRLRSYLFQNGQSYDGIIFSILRHELS